ncbi:MAG TPA: periplasmic heavy metal sensor [Chitinophagaceae bacterium]|jgi:Spy/CpxP family protein refolding chaperone|nr:periplasmic heavy metal sensor [Chitinophagaceae bacterium]
MKQFTQNKFLVLLVAILLVANLFLMLYFFVFKNHQEPERSHPVSDYMQKELGLNEEQTEKFKQLRDQHRAAVKPVVDEMKRLKDSLYNLLQDPQSNDSSARAIAEQIGDKQEEWEILIFQHFEKVRAICDSSQLPKLDTLVHKMINKWPWMRKKKPADR